MKSYSFLKTISTFLKIIAYINLISGIVIAVLFLLKINEAEYLTNESYMALATVVGVIILSIIFFIIFMAIAQLITLMIDIAQYAANIDHNIVVIAENSKK
jgi:hypothetical protein